MSTPIQPYPSLVLVQQILTCYGYPFIVVIGTLGNLLNIVLFLRKKLRTTSCNNYFLASAFINVVILYVGIIPILYTYNQPWAITATYCKIRSYMLNASQQMSRFFIVTACFDRFALCSIYVRLRQFSRVHIARRYMIPSIIIIWLIFPVHMLIFNTAINNSCMYLGAVALYHSIYSISLVGFIPPLLMFLFSFLTFRNLKSRQQRRQVVIVNTHLPTNRDRRQQKRDQQALGMLMIQVIVYVCTTTINSINSLYSILTTYIGIEKSNRRKSIETFITFITGMLNYSCPCLSFYLFLLVSNLYRKQMKMVILHFFRRCYFLQTRNNNNNNNNNNIGGTISMRQMTARVKPIEQPATIPRSATTNKD